MNHQANKSRSALSAAALALSVFGQNASATNNETVQAAELAKKLKSTRICGNTFRCSVTS